MQTFLAIVFCNFNRIVLKIHFTTNRFIMLKYSINKHALSLNRTCFKYMCTNADSKVPQVNLSDRVSIAFSGCGWLTPFHLGVCNKLKQNDLLKNMEIVAGTSGGSLAALIACTTQDFEVQKEAIKKFGNDWDFLRNIDSGLKNQMHDMLPSNAAELCNNRLYVTVSRLFPKANRKCLIISQFNSNDDIVNAVAASCFIPLYSNRSVYTLLNSNFHEENETKNHLDNAIENNENFNAGTSIKPHSSNRIISNIHPDIHPKFHKFLHHSKDNHFDKVADGFFKGGILPPIGDINVSPYPKKVFQWENRNKIPDINLENISTRSYGLGKLLYYSFKPGDPQFIEELYQDGMLACENWIRKQPHHQ